MYVNKCTKCGAEFETKNPKRVICPNCLYPDKKDASDNSDNANQGGYSNQDSQESSYERPSPSKGITFFIKLFKFYLS